MILKLVVAYDGTDFHGWAMQPGLRTVEGVMVRALARTLRANPVLSVAGRTDAGVHARGQVVSFETPHEIDPERIRRTVNGILSPEVVVLSAQQAPEGFDARHSARAREYRYRIDLGPNPDPFTARYVWHRPGTLAISAMRRAARDLVGEHDFASFGRRPQERGASTVRRLERLAVARHGDRLEISARATAFLHQMVRSLVGTLVAVGEGRLPADSMGAILTARDRSAAWQIAPPRGLTLVRIRYSPLNRP